MSVKDLLAKDFRTKAVAAAIAVGVWFYAYSSSLATKDGVAVPVNILTDPGWVITHVRAPGGGELPVESDAGNATAQVEVTLRYPRRAEYLIQEAIRAGKIYGEIDARSSEATERGVSLFPADFHAPTDLSARVVEVKTPSLRLTLTHEVTRPDVEVELTLSDPPPGARIQNVYAFPRRVAVTGPKHVVERLDRIQTERISISDLRPQFGVAIPIFARINERVVIDGEEHTVQCDETIRCSVYLAPDHLARTFEDVPVQLLMPPDLAPDFKLELSKTAIPVEVTGSPHVVNDLRVDDILLFVDLRAMDPTPGSRQYHSVRWSIAGVSPGDDVRVREPEQISSVVIAETEE